jgi:hypothetical protein
MEKQKPKFSWKLFILISLGLIVPFLGLTYLGVFFPSFRWLFNIISIFYLVEFYRYLMTKKDKNKPNEAKKN